jgi:hypothetical protein
MAALRASHFDTKNTKEAKRTKALPGWLAKSPLVSFAFFVLLV